MTISFPTSLRSARATAVLTALDAGSGAGKVRIYSGTKPASGGTATTLLAELTLSDPSGTVTNGVLTLSAITQDSSADATGTATWFRALDSNNNWVIDGTVGASGADLNLVTTSITAGQPVQISSFAMTEGNA